jgi:hypothetical protein
MSKISTDFVRSDLEKHGWKLLSEEYKKLDAEIYAECPEGHKIISSYKALRHKFICPVCQSNEYKNQEFSCEHKNKDDIRCLSLDQSTKISGWSIYTNQKLSAHGTYVTSKSTESERINDVKSWLISMCSIWKPDYVSLEDIQLEVNRNKNTDYNLSNADSEQNVITFKVLAHLQGVLMDSLFENKIQFELLPVSIWRKEIGIRGRTKADKKKSAQLIVKELFDISVGEDEAEAICMGKVISARKNKANTLIKWG